MTRGILLLAILCTLAALVLSQDRQSGWYSSRSRPRRPYTQPSPDDDDEPSFGTREDYGSRDPGYGRRTRPGSSRRPVSQPDSRSRQPVLGGYPEYAPKPPPYSPRQPGYDQRQPQPPPNTPRQPVFGGYDPRQPQPPPETPRQPVFGGYDPRQPQPPPETPRQPVFGGYDPRPYEPNPPRQPSRFPPQSQPDNLGKDEMRVLPVDGLFRGPDILPLPGAPYPYLHGKKQDIGGGQTRVNNCELSCRGQCTIRDYDNCNCKQNMTCFNELKHRLDSYSHSLTLPVRGTSVCPDESECGECGYLVIWPDDFCLCEKDPNCTPRTSSNNRKREVDLQKLIAQRDAHMAELKRASRHSKKTKRHTMSQTFN